ncbi:aminotransferase class III-fold pyridoxal phosphate-dependent enzyme [Paraburkholderia sp.]|uniref:aminotransferase class III-fold pyridoxal phosphate-dependent enzyme n=1 Tax=Paraburkholderia sp. TaxID=1926495 RepID=UPI002392936A|nr:aminotransferase class III-fold pyridoxal phosphate-dependent enzyme [Paraburkholderia sp.]MDE1180644.1 aminotransferase class III-fold pyridoxal phosphate-dependent enzyme [Paraburkholderia sp.]
MSSTYDDLQQRRRDAVARGVNQAHPIYAACAVNDRVWDTDGKPYIDFTSGIAALNTGHRHPHVMAAIDRQLAAFTHTCFAALPYEPYIALCERINGLMPGDGPMKTALFTTGSEAVESALKIARAHTRRSGVIAFTGAYHGRTLMTLALTAKVAPYASAMGLMPGHVYRARFPDARHGVDVDEAIDSIERIFRSDAAPDDIAAIVFEPVQGEGGAQVAPASFVQRLRALCDRHGIVLIADEVQTGAARTGSFFAIEQMGASADLVVFGKSVAAGMPLSGVVGRAALVDSVAPGGLGGTFAGSPVACAAALAVLDVIERERLVERARQIGETMRGALLSMQRRYPAIADVRGLGAMIGVELQAVCDDGVSGAGSADHAPGRSAAEYTKAIVAAARERGLLLLAGGMDGNVLRLLPPLTLELAHLEHGLNVLDACFATV